MSLTSSAASVVLVLASKGPDCARSRSAKSSRTAGRSSANAGRKSRASKTSASSRQIDWLQSELWTSFLAASRAKTSASPETAQDSPERAADCGASSIESSKRSGRRTRSSKTSAPFDLEDWSKCSGSSLRSGMTRNGIAFPLLPLAHSTGETASGLLPTPTATRYGSTNNGSPRDGRTQYRTRGTPSLTTMAARGLWPTPTSRDWKDGSAKSCRNVPVNALLGRAIHNWPTPTWRDSTNSRNATCVRYGENKGHAGTTLTDAVVPAGGALNPTWVEWLMGFPLGWTALEPSEMPSSRRLSRSSAVRS